MQSKEERNITYRGDIQVLRAIAVIVVILYHAKMPFLKSGLLGVDIFLRFLDFLLEGLSLRNPKGANFHFGNSIYDVLGGYYLQLM